ncbi:PREDICTED: putative uncharacterized protein CXorf30, partial [Galeopterus variegatus]|uniref:CFAP47-like immunoglobulin-like domain-containing protein n=1 Tax=Galeopterus variegatus TaxID=482537 RepID=A0ABM0S6D7_GALVR
REEPRDLVIDHSWNSFIKENSAFGFSPVSHMQGIVLPPEGIIDIPVLFLPQIMKLHKTLAIVQMMKVNRENWPIDNFDELDTETKRTMGIERGEIQKIPWIYPILGLPQAPHPKSPEVVITCQSKKRVEEKVEVMLTGDFFGENPTPEETDFLVIPKRSSDISYEDLHDKPKNCEFEYEIQFESEVMKSNLESCVALYLIKKSYNVHAEIISLVFNLVFTPKKPLWSHVTLKIDCITYGIWRFPITLVATEPDVDDVMDIEGVGLFKESVIDFRLTSQTRNSEPFTAYFLPGSDPEFFVRPQVGELLPFDTDGTLIIVGFKPQMYSRIYKGTLVIQTEHMYWSYDINGLPLATTPLKAVKAKIDASNKKYDSVPIRRRNFICENAKLIRTRVSSTIKGAPLMRKKK